MLTTEVQDKAYRSPGSGKLLRKICGGTPRTPLKLSDHGNIQYLQPFMASKLDSYRVNEKIDNF